jgi:hypothetical protein
MCLKNYFLFCKGKKESRCESEEINVNYDTKKIESYKVLCFKNLVGDFSLLSRDLVSLHNIFTRSGSSLANEFYTFSFI